MEPEEMNLMTAVKQVLKKALIDDQLARGAREATKALDSGDVSCGPISLKAPFKYPTVFAHLRVSIICLGLWFCHTQAKLCLFAQDCDEEQYTRVIEALCNAQKVHLIRVPEKLQLGEWAGQCKIDQDGNATKVTGCSCVVVKDFGERSAGLEFLEAHIQSTMGTAGGDEGED